jgi:apolipoprotein D and lipocalin family protein
LSRTPELTYPIKQALVSQAKTLGFSTDKLIYVNQNPDIPNYEAGLHVIKKETK